MYCYYYLHFTMNDIINNCLQNTIYNEQYYFLVAMTTSTIFGLYTACRETYDMHDRKNSFIHNVNE